jgi:hypothetical protein
MRPNGIDQRSALGCRLLRLLTLTHRLSIRVFVSVTAAIRHRRAEPRLDGHAFLSPFPFACPYSRPLLLPAAICASELPPASILEGMHVLPIIFRSAAARSPSGHPFPFAAASKAFLHVLRCALDEHSSFQPADTPQTAPASCCKI